MDSFENTYLFLIQKPASSLRLSGTAGGSRSDRSRFVESPLSCGTSSGEGLVFDQEHVVLFHSLKCFVVKVFDVFLWLLTACHFVLIVFQFYIL